jgi:hypothetical protein
MLISVPYILAFLGSFWGFSFLLIKFIFCVYCFMS